MKRWVVTGAAALMALFLTACGGTAEVDALRAENASLTAKNQTLQEENRRLTQALAEQASGQTAEETDESSDASPEAHNPIDDFFDNGRYWDCGTTAAMRTVADAYSRAWETALRTLAEQQKEALLYQEDRDLVDAFVRAVEDQADCMLDLNAFSLADLEAAPGEARLAAAGTLLGPLPPKAGRRCTAAAISGCCTPAAVRRLSASTRRLPAGSWTRNWARRSSGYGGPRKADFRIRHHKEQSRPHRFRRGFCMAKGGRIQKTGSRIQIEKCILHKKQTIT